MATFDPSCIDVEDFLSCLDIQNVSQATQREMRFSCPFPAHAGGDSSPSAYMNVESTAFFCHSCHAKGNAIHFAAQALDVSVLEAIRLLRQRYSPGGIDPDARDMVAEVKKARWPDEPEPLEFEILDERVLEQFTDFDWDEAYYHWENGNGFYGTDYMFERNFAPFTLEDWQFGWDDISGRIVLPVRNEKGLLVGFKARAPDDHTKPKYLNLGGPRYGWKPFYKNSVVFGLDRAIRADQRDLIVVEGELNVVQMHSWGYTNAVSINGSYFGPQQIRLLRQYADSVLVFFDSDAAGYDATDALVAALKPYMPIKVAPDHEGDPADMEQDEIKACIEESLAHTAATMLRSR